MPRHSVRSTLLLVPALASAAVLAAACSGGAEEQLITRFFAAARIRDNATLANIASVTFSPNTEGVVEDFTVTEIGAEERRTVNLGQLSETLTKAQEEEAEFGQKRQAFEKANDAAVVRILNAQNAKQTLRGRDAELYAELQKWQSEHAVYQRQVAETRGRYEDDRAQAEKSLAGSGVAATDLAAMDIELVTKRVTIEAMVRPPGGEVAPRTIVFTLRRAVGTQGGETREGRWVIAGLE